MMRLLGRVVADEVHRHVVGGSERRREVVGPRGREPRDPLERHLALVDDDRVSERVDPSPARASRELRVLTGRDQLVALALELPEVLDHDALGGHVDPQREGLRREDHLHEPFLEQLLDRLLEHGEHARVVGGDAGGQGLEELRESEAREVVLVHPRGPGLGPIPDRGGLLPGREADPRVPEPAHALLAAGPAEHEVDRRQHPFLREHVDHLLAAGDVDAAVALPGSGDPLVLRQPRPAPVVRLRLQLVLVQGDDVGVRHQDPVLLDVHRMQPGPHEVVMLERYRAALLDHDAGVATEGRDPLAELLRVRDRRGERDHAHGGWEVDQDLLPHGATVGVLQVVHLVHHDGVQARECGRSLVQHVAEDLGGHDDDGRLRIDRVVAREETDRPRAVFGDEIAELLVRQGLQRGRVEGLGAAVERALDGELRDDGLPRAGRRGHEGRHPAMDGIDRLVLERVEREGELPREVLGRGHGGASLRAVLRCPGWDARGAWG